MIENLWKKRIDFIEAEAKKAVEQTVTENYLATHYAKCLKLSVKQTLIKVVAHNARRAIVIDEPDCGKPCSPEQYAECLCHGCAKYTFGFWNDPLEPFTDQQRKDIAALFNPTTGFLTPTGCALIRELRPSRCMVGLCSNIPENILEANYNY